MTRSHRRAHLAAWLILGPLSIILLLAAIASRPPDPIQPAQAEHAP